MSTDAVCRWSIDMYSSPGNGHDQYAKINKDNYLKVKTLGMSNGKEKYSQQLEEREETRTEKPSLYNVFLLNDDYTTMEFVVHILEETFHKNLTEATQIMLHVHKQGVGLAGVYPREIAETKVESVHRIARENGFPLKCIMEKKND